MISLFIIGAGALIGLNMVKMGVHNPAAHFTLGGIIAICAMIAQ